MRFKFDNRNINLLTGKSKFKRNIKDNVDALNFKYKNIISLNRKPEKRKIQ
jgi:hypothetical protein